MITLVNSCTWLLGRFDIIPKVMSYVVCDPNQRPSYIHEEAVVVRFQYNDYFLHSHKNILRNFRNKYSSL